MDYDKQAKDFLKETNTTFEAEFLKYDKHFEGDTERRDIYTITLTRGSRSFSFEFGQSIQNSMQWIPNTKYAKNLHKEKGYPRLAGESRNLALKKIGIFYASQLMPKDFIKNEHFAEPSEYDVLTCLSNYDVGTLEEFCGDFGYNADSIKDNKIYEAVLKEYQNVCMLWNEEEIKKLAEIQ